MRFQRPRKSGNALAIAVLVMGGLFLLLVVLSAPKGRFNWGFGPQWDCGNSNPIDVSCQLKR
jgi:hypothetical protein